MDTEETEYELESFEQYNRFSIEVSGYARDGYFDKQMKE